MAAHGSLIQNYKFGPTWRSKDPYYIIWSNLAVHGSVFHNSDQFGGPWIPASLFKNSDQFGGPWIPAFLFKNWDQLGGPWIHASLLKNSDKNGGPWIPISKFGPIRRSMDPWANFILIIYIGSEKEQKNVSFHHLIQISGEIRHFLVQCPHSTRKCLISPLKMFFLSQYVERWDKKMSYFVTKNVLFRHRFPVLFLLPRYDES